MLSSSILSFPVLFALRSIKTLNVNYSLFKVHFNKFILAV